MHDRRIVCKTNLSEDEDKELDLVKSQLEAMDLKRIQGNKIRSGAKWLESNEQPSRFFFQKEKRRALKKTCHALRTSDGRLSRMISQRNRFDFIRNFIQKYRQTKLPKIGY